MIPGQCPKHSWEDNIKMVIKYVKLLFEGCINIRYNTEFV
jgi:hypothetical protein